MNRIVGIALKINTEDNGFKLFNIEKVSELLKNYGVVEVNVLPEIVSPEEKRDNYAGKQITNPEKLKDGTKVTMREIGTYFSNSGLHSFWEHGEIYTDSKGNKRIDTYDSTYAISDNIWELYEDTREI